VPERVWQASLQPLDGRVSLPLAPPADALPNSGRVAVSLQPTLGGALPGLRRWFEAYPYTCLEQ
jgi:alpha-2-macroglobulin